MIQLWFIHTWRSSDIKARPSLLHRLTCERPSTSVSARVSTPYSNKSSNICKQQIQCIWPTCMYDADHIFFLLSDMARNSFNPTTYVKFEATAVFPLNSISSSLATSSLLEVHPAMWKETKGCRIMVFLWHIPPFEEYLAAPTCLSTVYTPTGVDQCTC